MQRQSSRHCPKASLRFWTCSRRTFYHMESIMLLSMQIFVEDWAIPNWQISLESSILVTWTSVCSSNAMHHLSTLNMLNRNRTVSSFLASLTAEEEQRVFKLSSKKAASIRKLHTEQEQQAIQRKRQHLEEVKQRKAAMEEKKRARKEAIFDKIRLHGGPCRTTEDVNRLLSHYRKKTDRVHAVRAEIHFHKYIMDRKSPLLKVTAKLPEQLVNLQQFLQNLGPAAPQAEVPDRREPVRDLSEEADAVQEVQTHDGQHDFNFKFSNAGVPVAVFYDNDHYLGEVTTVHTQELASVSFMQRCLIRSDAYRWPHTPDETEVDARYVFSPNFGLSSTNGRVDPAGTRSTPWTAVTVQGTILLEKSEAGAWEGRSCSTSSSTGECEWINYVYFDCSYSFLFKVWMWRKFQKQQKMLNLFFCHEKWWLGGWVCFVGGDGKIP